MSESLGFTVEAVKEGVLIDHSYVLVYDRYEDMKYYETRERVGSYIDALERAGELGAITVRSGEARYKNFKVEKTVTTVDKTVTVL